jgi:type II secretory pathway component PulL
MTYTLQFSPALKVSVWVWVGESDLPTYIDTDQPTHTQIHTWPHPYLEYFEVGLRRYDEKQKCG